MNETTMHAPDAAATQEPPLPTTVTREVALVCIDPLGREAQLRLAAQLAAAGVGLVDFRSQKPYPANAGEDTPVWVLMQSPTAALARHLSSGGSPTIEEVLQDWCDTARRALAWAHAYRDHCRMLDAEELDLLALEPDHSNLRKGVASSSIPDWLLSCRWTDEGVEAFRLPAHILALQHGPCRSLWLEVQNSCWPVLDAGPAEDPALVAIQAAGRLKEWHKEHAAQIAELEDRVAIARSRVAAQATETDALRNRLLELDSELELTNLQFQQAQEEADTLHQQLAAERRSNEILNGETHTLRMHLDAALATQVQQVADLRDQMAILLAEHAEQLRFLEAQSKANLAQLQAEGKAQSDLTCSAHEEALRELRVAHSQSLEHVRNEREELANALDIERRQHARALEALQQQHAQELQVLQQAAAQSQATEHERIRRAEASLEAVTSELAAVQTKWSQELHQRATAPVVPSEEADRQLANQAARLEELKGWLAQANTRIELLQMQRDDAHEALDLALAAAASPSALGADQRVQGAFFSLVPTLVRDTPPHRELTLLANEVACPTGHRNSLKLRLVEHESHPGLVLFADDQESPLHHWSVSGQEDGKDYMLLVPSDPNSRQVMRHLPPADWFFLLDMAQTLEQEIRGLDLPPRWSATSTRLRMGLQALPPRLRYDSLNVEAQLIGEQSCDICVELTGSVHGSRRLTGVAVVWRLQPRKGSLLQWQLPDAGPPLLSWPTLEDGTFRPHYPLALGSYTDSPKSTWWAQLPGLDRQLIMSMLEVLPAAAESQRLPAQWAARIASDAVALRLEAGRLAGTDWLRDMARRVVRRKRQDE